MASTVDGPTVQDLLSTYLTGKTLKAMLVNSTYTFNRDTHSFRSDVIGEVSGANYPSGGITLNNVTIQLDAGNHRVEIVADDAAFGMITADDVAQLVVYVDTGDPATDRILSVHTFTPATLSNRSFAYAWNDDDTDPATKGVIAYIGY